ncbi:NAD-binding protein [Variovorax sp. LjRoot178]|uniref:NAD-binding protein n=1 Tax=Variovorax sp. LjRoot178 TaxID=3342277 RepID=UPI003ED10FD0
MIGFVGLGAMGAPMARRLASLGYELVVHDVDSRAVQAVAAAGAAAAWSVKDIAERAELVFTCLPSLEAIEKVVLGPGGLAEGRKMKVLVDCSTTGPDFAREVAAALSARDVLFLDAPITGNVASAGNGMLGIMCSGPAPAFETAQAAMQALASTTLLYLGEVNGRAQRLKLLNNLLSASGMAASCEAFILGVKAGLAPELMLEVLNAGEASSSATRNKFASAILPRKFDFGARMAITAKDTSLTVREAEALGVPMWIGQAVQQLWQFAASQGGAERDGTSLITYLEPWAGVQVRAGVNACPQPEATGEAAGEIVVLCDAALAEALGAFRTLTVAPEDDLQAWVHALPPVPCIIVNCCLRATDVARQLCKMVTDEGNGYADAIPTGEGLLLTSGPAASARQLQELASALASRVAVVSPTAGHAQMMQLLNGSLASVLLAVACESYVAGAKSGLDPVTMRRILGLETGRNHASAHILPEQVATRRFKHGKALGQAHRELTLLVDEARRVGVTTWVLEKARLLYGLAIQLGSAEDDISRIATHYETWAGAQVRLPGCNE